MIRIGGDVISDQARGILVPPRARNFGMVFQSYAVWPHMTVRQNVVYPLRNRGLSRTETARRVTEVLDLVDLAPYIDRPVTALSGGQMQRVALARSMVYEPRLLVAGRAAQQPRCAAAPAVAGRFAPDHQALGRDGAVCDA